jgi:Dolichyl-phosphate-mannose-protein mannosyltransferase
LAPLGRTLHSGVALKASESAGCVRGFQALILFAIVATAARAAVVWFTEPSPREAYYFLCSQNPAPAYFDGPGGTAAAIRLASLEADSDVIWRLAAPFWALCATFACFGLVWALAGTGRGVGVALLLNTLPIFNSTALRVGPELPALTFALLGMLAAWRASRANRGKLLWWAGAGLLFGAAAWFAYGAAAILFGLICIALHDPERRRTAIDFYAGFLLLVIPALCLIPPLLWNAQQDWIPIAGGTLRTVWEFDLAGSLQSLSSMLESFSPLLLPAIPLGCLLAFLDSRKGSATARFIFWCGLPGVLLGIYFVLRGGSGVFYFLLVAPVLLLKATDLFASRPRLAASLRWSAVILACIFSLYAILEAVRAGHGWRQTASELGGVFLERSAEGQNDLFLIAEDAKLASVLGYYLRNDFVAPAGHPTVYVRESQDISNQFAFWPSYADFTETGKVTDEYFTEQQAENAFLGRSALYITHESPDALPQTIEAAFDSVSLFRELLGAGDDARPLYIYLCLIYQTLPL